MEVSRQEQIFRASEARLDLLLAQAMSQLGEHSINCEDDSVRSYNYKESYLSWSARFFRTWPQDIFTCQVQVQVSCRQPVQASDEPRVTVKFRAEKFRTGQRSSVDQVAEHEFTLDQVAEQGLGLLVLGNFQQGASLLGVAL